jgi:hypothetical protein
MTPIHTDPTYRGAGMVIRRISDTVLMFLLVPVVSMFPTIPVVLVFPMSAVVLGVNKGSSSPNISTESCVLIGTLVQMGWE